MNTFKEKIALTLTHLETSGSSKMYEKSSFYQIYEKSSFSQKRHFRVMGYGSTSDVFFFDSFFVLIVLINSILNTCRDCVYSYKKNICICSNFPSKVNRKCSVRTCCLLVVLVASKNKVKLEMFWRLFTWHVISEKILRDAWFNTKISVMHA